MATSVLVSLIVLLSLYGFQVDGHVDRYAFNIVVNGTSVNEQVEVDVENQIEVIRVPQHNNEVAVEIMNDFDAGLSARRFPEAKDCHVSKLDSSFPSPEKMKLDMDQASRQSLPNKETPKRTGWRVVGFADRLTLPEKILDFCGSFPIYNVEAVPLDSMNVTLHRVTGHGRRKRCHNIPYFYGCSRSDVEDMVHCLNKVGHANIWFSCKYDTMFCSYGAYCKHQPTSIPSYFCTGVVHLYNYGGICCTPYC